MSDISIAGNIGQTPELRFSKAGKANMMFSVAVTTGRNETKAVHWFDVKCFDILAERIAELTKGDRVLVKGRMKEDEWTNKEGKTTKKLRLYADAVEFAAIKMIDRFEAHPSGYQMDPNNKMAQARSFLVQNSMQLFLRDYEDEDFLPPDLG